VAIILELWCDVNTKLHRCKVLMIIKNVHHPILSGP
jgi:hypothetical protein